MIGRSPMVVSVVPSVHTPHLFSEEEINKFYKSTHKENLKPELECGDVVLVKDGYLKGLYGLVVKNTSSGLKLSKNTTSRFKISFRFHIRKFCEIIKSSSLEKVGNLNRHISIKSKSGQTKNKRVKKKGVKIITPKKRGSSFANNIEFHRKTCRSHKGRRKNR
jgi:hypothetical protein